MRLFFYEYATAQPADAEVPLSVRREGRAMFDVVQEDARAVRGLDLVTLQTGESEEAHFRKAARGADAALIVAPEFDGILETRCRWVEEAGCQLLGPSPEGVRRTADKWELYRHWRQCGVPTPTTWRAGEWAGVSGQEPVRERFLQKHRYGAGSLGVGFITADDRVPDDRLIQQWAPGVAASSGLIIDVHGGVHALPPGRQCISEDGSFSYLGGRLPLEAPLGSRLIRLAIQAVESINHPVHDTGGPRASVTPALKPPLLGYVGVDAILGEAGDGSLDYVLEINPRLTTSYVGLRRATSTNLVEVMLRAVEGKPVPEIVWDRLPVRFTAEGMVRH